MQGGREKYHNLYKEISLLSTEHYFQKAMLSALRLSEDVQ